MKLMTHLYYGDPSPKFSQQLARTLLTSGADILEVGIAYTDPVCDGEVFQRACYRALGVGVTPMMTLEGIIGIKGTRLRRSAGKAFGDARQGYGGQVSGGRKIYLTSYYGPIFKMGVDAFTKQAKEVGVTGLIVPDLLLEEQRELRKACDRYGLSLIQFATVYSTKERLKQICGASTDFIYCISLPGVTGEVRDKRELETVIKTVKSMTDRPVYVGFGIRSAKDANEILSYGADGIIVGSAIARMYENYLRENKLQDSLPKIAAFIKELKECTM